MSPAGSVRANLAGMAESAKSIGGYRLGRKVRTGPHLAVFSSEDNLGREIEVSCYRASSLRDRTGRDAFLAEARKSAALHHENLCPMVNAGEDDEVWFSVSVAPDAPSIRDLIERGGALAPERVEVVAERILAALEHLRDAELRHGDIRPETVFLSGPRVLLGPRRLIPLGVAERDIRYLAPEEIRAEGTDIRADLFAFGTVLFEALTGRQPFSGKSRDERLPCIAGGPPELPPGTPAGLARLTQALLAGDPAARPTTAATAAGLLVDEDPFAMHSEAPPPAAAATVARPAPRRGPGSLSFERDGEPAVYELWDDEAFVTLGPDGPVFHANSPRGALGHFECGGSGDVLHALPNADPHPRVNGSLIDRHELSPGDEVHLGDAKLTYGPARTDSRRPPVSATRRERVRRTVILVSFFLSLGVLAWGAYRIKGALESGGDILLAADRAEKELAGARKEEGSGTVSDTGLTIQAKMAFEKAQALATKTPGAFDEIRKRFKDVRDKFGPTAYGYLAQKEMDDNEVRRRKATDREFGEIAKEVAGFIRDGRLYDAYALLDTYEQTHPGTSYAGRAEREALNLLETITARFNEDMDRVHIAERQGDYGLALDILARVKVYSGPDERTKVERAIRAIRKRIRETQLPAGATPGPEKPVADAPKDPPRPPEPDRPDVPEPPAADPVAERKASMLLEKARKAYEREKWEDAFETAEKLAEFRMTAVYGKNAKEIARILGIARLEFKGIEALFRGRVKVIRGREIEITYDFSDEAQAKDWAYMSPFAHPLSGSFWHQNDALHGRGVGAAVHPGEFEPGTLLLKARVKALEPHDFGFLMLEPEDQANYFCFAGQNKFFVIKQDIPCHENTLWVVGPGAWADTPDGFLGMVRKNGSPKPPVTAGEWLTIEGNKVKGTMELVIKGTSIKGAALGDNRYMFPALQPAVYVLTGDALFDDIVIRGTLKESWIKNRMRWERKKILDH